MIYLLLYFLIFLLIFDIIQDLYNNEVFVISLITSSILSLYFLGVSFFRFYLTVFMLIFLYIIKKPYNPADVFALSICLMVTKKKYINILFFINLSIIILMFLKKILFKKKCDSIILIKVPYITVLNIYLLLMIKSEYF
jgi:hypothetical protein